MLLLAHGVTTIREVGDADGTTWRGQERIERGMVPGPRVFTCGPVLDGDPPFLPTSRVIRDATEAREAVTTLAARGADFIKVHHKVSAEVLAAVHGAADEAGLYVVGHIPVSVPFEQANVWDMQHLDGLIPYCGSPIRRPYGQRMRQVGALMCVRRRPGIVTSPGMTSLWYNSVILHFRA
ncbi:MAG: hypothetical protein ACP5JG_05115 [Anaerolineae bacterium]